jgi:hypothetical protein
MVWGGESIAPTTLMTTSTNRPRSLTLAFVRLKSHSHA